MFEKSSTYLDLKTIDQLKDVFLLYNDTFNKLNIFPELKQTTIEMFFIIKKASSADMERL